LSSCADTFTYTRAASDLQNWKLKKSQKSQRNLGDGESNNTTTATPERLFGFLTNVCLLLLHPLHLFHLAVGQTVLYLWQAGAGRWKHKGSPAHPYSSFQGFDHLSLATAL
jgi:hypothetical protein